eukprot:TRINITY_DN11517_c1_g1_i1.p1 TRINITY_DN11517_c1_g1~~TRINITY_DN11517_c1_g1_i1.p1  ORF type:complete len:508 (-),score=109.03 TRINITY_DN11517_c1_g1_i1:383-1906(-)
MATLRNVYIAFSFIALGGMLFGYIIGINGNVVTPGQLVCPSDWTGENGTWTSRGYKQCYQLSPLDMGVLSSLNLIGACLSSLVCFRFADSLGRKLEVQIGAFLYMVGAAIAALSPMLIGIYIGFAVYGLGIGFAMHAAPVYIAEISPAEVRGTLVSAKEAVIVTGIFLGFFFGFIFSSIEFSGWRYMVGISGVVAIVVQVGITFIPQSPRYLLLRAAQRGGLLGPDAGMVAEAGRALKFFRGTEDVSRELEAMRTDIANAVGAEPVKCTAACGYPRQLTIGCGLVLLQQVTGQPSVLYFATNIFLSAGFGDSAALSSVGVGLVKLLATLFTVWRVDDYGRKRLLYIGISMMAVALAIVGVSFAFRECLTEGTSLADCDPKKVGLPRPLALLTVAGLMLYVSGYQVGFGPISWLMISEVFPLRVRGAALSLAAIVNFGSNILMTLTAEVLMNALTPSGVFSVYFVLSLVSLVFVRFVIPETKGKTLEEIEEMLKGKRPAREVNTATRP